MYEWFMFTNTVSSNVILKVVKIVLNPINDLIIKQLGH